MVDLNEQQAIWLDIRRKFVPGADAIRDASRVEMKNLIDSVVDNVDIYEPFPVSSHRRFFGPIIVFGKQSLQKILRPILKIGFARQLTLNENLLVLTTIVSELQLQVDQLQRRIQALEQQRKT
jgi:hypothetical protein